MSLFTNHACSTVFLPEPLSYVKNTIVSILLPKDLLSIGEFLQESSSGRITACTHELLGSLWALNGMAIALCVNGAAMPQIHGVVHDAWGCWKRRERQNNPFSESQLGVSPINNSAPMQPAELEVFICRDYTMLSDAHSTGQKDRLVGVLAGGIERGVQTRVQYWSAGRCQR